MLSFGLCSDKISSIFYIVSGFKELLTYSVLLFSVLKGY